MIQQLPAVLGTLQHHPLLQQVARMAAEQGYPPVYLVGGFLRDALLKRSGSFDIDFVSADPSSLTAALQERFAGTVIRFSQGVHRIVFLWRGERVQVDISPLEGKNIIDDLQRRDFTINAIGFCLGGEVPRLIDPVDGVRDLAVRRIRVTDPMTLSEDPLRLLRAIRLAAHLDFVIDKVTAQAIRHRASLVSQVASERLREEFFEILDCQNAGRWLGVMDELGLLEALFPETGPMRGCVQDPPHHFDVLTHSLETVRSLDRILRALPTLLPDEAGSLAGPLHAEVEGGITRRALLRFTALLHDVGKPDCRSTENGQIRFLGHAERGAGIVEVISRRLRLGSRAGAITVALVREHLRPLSLRQSEPLTRRARYRFWRDLGDVAPDLLILSLADIRATWGAEGKPFRAHLRFIREMFAFHRQQMTPTVLARLVNGDEVMARFHLTPGPFLGFVLERIREEAGVGSLKTKDEALVFLENNLDELREEFARGKSP